MKCFRQICRWLRFLAGICSLHGNHIWCGFSFDSCFVVIGGKLLSDHQQKRDKMRTKRLQMWRVLWREATGTNISVSCGCSRRVVCWNMMINTTSRQSQQNSNNCQIEDLFFFRAFLPQKTNCFECLLQLLSKRILTKAHGIVSNCDICTCTCERTKMAHLNGPDLLIHHVYLQTKRATFSWAEHS